jgi:hypothetical protein
MRIPSRSILFRAAAFTQSSQNYSYPFSDSCDACCLSSEMSCWSENKRIGQCLDYTLLSLKQRLELLCGMMDTISLTSRDLIEPDRLRKIRSVFGLSFLHSNNESYKAIMKILCPMMYPLNAISSCFPSPSPI